MEEKEIHINNGDEYLEEEEYHKAISEYESAAKLTNDSKELSKLYVKIGMCYQEFCEYTEIGFDDAGIYFELAYEEDSENEDAVRAVGMEYLHWKDDAACTYFEKLIDWGKADDHDREELFLCYNRLGRFEDADRVLEDSIHIGWWCGKYYMNIQRYEKALMVFGMALEKRLAAEEWIPYDIYFFSGKCYEHLKEFKKAEEIYLYGLQQYEQGFEQEQFYHALFLLYIRTCDFEKIRKFLKKAKMGWIFSAVIEYETEYVENLYHKKQTNKKKLTGIIKKVKYLYEQDNNHLYPYALLAAGDLCRFYANDFEQARQFYQMAVGCMGLYSLSVSAKDLLIQVYLGYMEMAYEEKKLTEVNRYAVLLMGQVQKMFHTKEESLTHFVENEMNRDIIYRYYCCLGDKEKADCYYDSLWDTPFVISKYLIRAGLISNIRNFNFLFN